MLAKGIGRASALAFAREGASVAVADLDQQAGGAVVKAIQDAGGKAILVQGGYCRRGICKKTCERNSQGFWPG